VPFTQCLERFWNDRELDTYILSETKYQNIDGVKFINTRIARADWTSNLLFALDHLNTKYVCFLLEDFFLRSKVNNKRFKECLEFVESENIDMLRLIAKPTVYTKINFSDRDILQLSQHAPYRVSCQACIWNRKKLISLLKSGESAWEFEICGSQRSKNLNYNFFSVKKSVMTYRHHVVEKGKWFPWDAWYFTKLGIECDFASREIMTWSNGIIWLFRKCFNIIKRQIRLVYIGILQ
jgi:hypothetical protein